MLVMWCRDHCCVLLYSTVNLCCCLFFFFCCSTTISRSIVDFFYTSTILHEIRCLINAGFNRLESMIIPLVSFFHLVFISLSPFTGDESLTVELTFMLRSRSAFSVEIENGRYERLM